jgi:hypothetical protein
LGSVIIQANHNAMARNGERRFRSKHGVTKN